MKARCYSPSQTKGYYKAHNITVCDEWKNNFDQFMRDMGPIPGADYSIERIDNYKGYFPSNCKWIPMKDQAKNRTSCRIFTMNGETHNLKDWSRIYKIKYTTLYSRVYRYGMSFEDAIARTI